MEIKLCGIILFIHLGATINIMRNIGVSLSFFLLEERLWQHYTSERRIFNHEKNSLQCHVF